jgi:hypothetical protein
MLTVLVSAIRFMTGPSCAEAVHERAPSITEAIKSKRARFIKKAFPLQLQAGFLGRAKLGHRYKACLRRERSQLRDLHGCRTAATSIRRAPD